MECDICCNAYSEERQPKILSACGHTICSQCVTSLKVDSPFGPTIMCPNCRKGTLPCEIRTNYVVADIVRSIAESNLSRRTETLCKYHPNKPVCVLCETCGVFVCTSCFETNDTPHASHVRVSIDDGLKLVIQDKERIRENLKIIADTVRCKIILESSSLEQINQKLRLMALNAVEHYTATVSKLKTEVDAILTHLTNCQTFVGQDLQLLLGKQSHIQKLLHDVSDSQDIISAELFLQTRFQLDSAISCLSDHNQVSETLEKLEIDSEAAQAEPTSKNIVLPELILKDTSRVSLFDLLYPPGSDGVNPLTPRSCQSLHRSTSNDNLRN